MTAYGSLTHPLCRRYAALDDRLKSYKYALEHLKMLLPSLAEAGFYYKGEKDSTECFYCGFGLKDWVDSDEPWIDHAYWSPHCEFLLGNKTKKWIRQAFNARARLVDEVVPQDLPVDDPPSTLKCRICLERDLQIAFFTLWTFMCLWHVRPRTETLFHVQT
jgi:hypothetical protein